MALEHHKPFAMVVKKLMPNRPVGSLFFNKEHKRWYLRLIMPVDEQLASGNDTEETTVNTWNKELPRNDFCEMSEPPRDSFSQCRNDLCPMTELPREPDREYLLTDFSHLLTCYWMEDDHTWHDSVTVTVL